MTQSRKVKSTVLCDKFNEMFCEFLNENCKAEITKSFYKLNAYIDIFLSSDIKLKYFVNDDCGIYDLMFYVDNSYQYRFTFYTYICAVHLSVYNSNDKLLSAYTFAFDSHAISRFFNSIQIIDNTSELEQLEELTSLELTLFEAMKDCSNLEFEYIQKSMYANEKEEKEQERYFLELASNESSKSSVFEYLISKARLQEKYQAWLEEQHEKQYALTIIDDGFEIRLSTV